MQQQKKTISRYSLNNERVEKKYLNRTSQTLTSNLSCVQVQWRNKKLTIYFILFLIRYPKLTLEEIDQLVVKFEDKQQRDGAFVMV